MKGFRGTFFGSSSDHLGESFGKTVLFPKSFRRTPEGLQEKMMGFDGYFF
ncbi:MAG: hypothetical protein AB7E26_04330 [Chryseobacterium sp.]